MSKNIAIIADLHLDPNHPEVTELFAHFFQEYAHQFDAVYILGDLFEAWIGDDDISTFHEYIKAILKQFTDQHKQLFIMRGNRDFMLGTGFAQDVGAALLPDPCTIEVDQQTLLLTHGDLLCTDDTRHQRYRRWIQNPFSKACLGSLPLKLRRFIAQKLRSKSRTHFEQNNQRMEDVNIDTVLTFFDRYHCLTMIHGHTHLPGTHHDQPSLTRHVLGAWHKQGYALTLPNMEVLQWTSPSKPTT